MNALRFAVIGLIWLAACSSPIPAAGPAVLSNTLIPDDYAVYKVIINANWPQQAQLVIGAATVTQTLPGGQADVRGYVSSQLTGLQNQTTDSFLALNETAYPLTNQFQLSAPIVFLSQANQDLLFNADLQASWRKFYVRYPGAQGILSFSRPGYNAVRDQALVYYQNQSGSLDGAGYMALLSKGSAGWVIVNQLGLWIS